MAHDQHGRRGVAAAALRLEQVLHGLRGERIGADAVDGVGRQDDETTAPHGVDGGGTPDVAADDARLIAAVEGELARG